MWWCVQDEIGVLDMQFLAGYPRPTLCVLFQVRRAFSLRV
jgi:hypothetical protein